MTTEIREAKPSIRTFNPSDDAVEYGIDLDIRVLNFDGEPWFVAKDVCTALGYALRSNGTVNVNNIRSTLGVDEVITYQTGKKGRPSLCISESGLYKLIMRSDKPQARRFQDWVTKIVLPAIRKDGMYVAGEEMVSTGEMTEDELVLKAMETLKAKCERLSQENQVMSDELNRITVDEYRSLSHRYFHKGFSTKLGKRATKLAKQRGIQLEKQVREFVKPDGERTNTYLNVYPRDLLEEAEGEILGRG